MSDLTESVSISSITNLNTGLRSAHSSTMIQLLGAPAEPLVQHACRNGQASPAVARLLETRPINARFKLTGIKPALDSVQKVLANVKAARPDLFDLLDTEGMLCVRHKNPTNGAFSDDPSNHSWGTAVDFKLADGEAPGATGKTVPRWVAILVPFFNSEGWYSGIGFADAMHFEVADGTIRQWAKDGRLGNTAQVAQANPGAQPVHQDPKPAAPAIGGPSSPDFGAVA